MESIDAIYQNGAHYDRMWGRGYVDFWLAQAKARGGPILELGCGTGKLTIPLAEAGFQVTGLDNSPALLEFARNKSNAVQWTEADMREFDLDGRYNLTMLPSNNLGHLHTADDFANCIDCVKRHLLPGGVFVIDVFVPNLRLLLGYGDAEYELDSYDSPGGNGRVSLMGRSKYESVTQIVRTKTVRRAPGRPDVVGSLDLKMYFPAELAELIGLCGLRLVERYGDHSGGGFDNESRYQILVCEVSRA